MAMTDVEGFAVSITTLYDALGSIIMEGQIMEGQIMEKI